jgi:transcriptional regulator with XRE-family HTH domain
MDSIIQSITKKRKKLKWTKSELAEKANIPLKVLLYIEKGVFHWPEFLTRLEQILENALEERKKKSYIKPQEYFSHINKNEKLNFNTVSKYFVDTSDIDLNIYFPNLSEGEERMLFGYSKIDTRNEEYITYPKIKFRSKKKDERLGAALEHAKKLEASYPKNNRKIPRKYFTPNFNPIACKWFEKFDKVNNTKGLYATRGGEYYIEELGYFPDYFNLELKLIIEWDEPYHYTKNGELSVKDKKRQKAIQDLFPDYKFVRINETDFREYLDL